MVETPCPLCAARDPQPYLRVPDRLQPARGRIHALQRCLRCGLVYLSPRPTEEESTRHYAATDYQPFVSARGLAGDRLSFYDRLYVAVRRVNVRWKRRLIERWRRPAGRLLEIGCGTGELLAELRRVGWQVRGVERDTAAAAHAQQALQLAVWAGGLDALPGREAGFDVACLWHVLEHLHDPHGVLEQVRTRLAHDALLVLAVPNAQGLDARVYGASWVAYDAPRHLHHWSLDTLEQLCGGHGFRLLSAGPLPLDAAFNTLMSEHLRGQRADASAAWPLTGAARWRGGALRLLVGAVRVAAVLLASLSAGWWPARAVRARYASTLVTVWRRA
jgi:SAM-dependent methyltransferase